MRTDGWSELERRGRALVEEVRSGAAAGAVDEGSPGGGIDPPQIDVTWLRSATAWLAEVAPAWQDMAGCHPSGRAYRAICSYMALEAWLITWPAGGRLHLHDHGGAAGAFQVVRGRLMEEFAMAGPLQRAGTRRLRTSLDRRVLGEGRGASFASGAEGGDEYVHDVINPGGPAATSVHLYGPAVRPMAFYRVDGGRLRVLPASADTAAIVGADPADPAGPADPADPADPAGADPAGADPAGVDAAAGLPVG